MPINYSNYPPDWATIRGHIIQRAGGCCEGSPAYPDCRAANSTPHPVTGSKVVLTVAHLDHDTKNNEPGNLRAWCQRCHNTYDAHYRRRADKTSLPQYPYYFRVKSRLPQYHGYPCMVAAWGKKNSCLVVFADGHRVVTSRNYIRKRV